MSPGPASLTLEGCLRRRERLWQTLAIGEATAPDVVVLAAPEHLTYFSGFHLEPFTFRSNEAATALVLTRDRAALVLDNLIQPFASDARAVDVVATRWYQGTHPAAPRRSGLAAAVRDAVRSLTGPGRIRLGLDAAVPVAWLDSLTDRESPPIGLDAAIGRLRRAKEADELSLIRRSIAAIEAGLTAAFGVMEPGRTELAVYEHVEAACLASLGGRAVVYGDFACGRRSRSALGPPGLDRIEAGSLYILDFSVIVGGYRGDLANTFVVGGRPTGQQNELLDGCVAAIQAGEALLRPGSECRAIDAAVRAVLRERGLKPDDPSHIGHGVGLGHPEAPFLVRHGDESLAEGDVVTLEPGQYGFSFGGLRIEHNYRITADGCERLSRHRLALT